MSESVQRLWIREAKECMITWTNQSFADEQCHCQLVGHWTESVAEEFRWLTHVAPPLHRECSVCSAQLCASDSWTLPSSSSFSSYLLNEVTKPGPYGCCLLLWDELQISMWKPSVQLVCQTCWVQKHATSNLQPIWKRPCFLCAQLQLCLSSHQLFKAQPSVHLPKWEFYRKGTSRYVCFQ